MALIFRVQFLDILESGVSIIHDLVGDFLEDLVDGLDDVTVASLLSVVLHFIIFIFTVAIIVVITIVRGVGALSIRTTETSFLATSQGIATHGR